MVTLMGGWTVKNCRKSCDVTPLGMHSRRRKLLCERRGLTIRAMVLGRGFESRLLLKISWKDGQKNNEHYKDNQMRQVTSKNMFLKLGQHKSCLSHHGCRFSYAESTNICARTFYL